MTLQLYLEFWKHLFKLWWPVVLFIFIGLAVIGYTERRDKHGGHSNN